MTVRYNYRLRVSRQQAESLEQVFDTCRSVWNHALGRWQSAWRDEHLTLRYGDLDKELTARRAELEWLRSVPSVPEQQVLRDLDKSISAFFDKKNPVGYPKFKKKDRYATARWTKRGYRVTGTGGGAAGDRLSVAAPDGRTELRVVWSRPLPSEPASVTIYRNAAGRYFASFVVKIDVPEERVSPTGDRTGLDVGLTTFATTEHALHDIENPRYAQHAAKALARSQRNVSSKKSGSANRKKAKRRLAREHARVANQRLDFHHKAARKLVEHYDAIGIEDLKTKNMMARGKSGNRRKKAGLNRSISDASWAQFLRVLEFQAAKSGAEVVQIDPRNTTQCCSGCGTKAKSRLTLSDRVFRCDTCELVLDRDRNAARNLHPRDSQNRLDCTGRDDDGSKTTRSAELVAA
ncbi:MAG TPA: transposase [Acidimicrobiales bacterium]|nr:transposase [Acidimicrobiales bacterium]